MKRMISLKEYNKIMDKIIKKKLPVQETLHAMLDEAMNVKVTKKKSKKA